MITKTIRAGTRVQVFLLWREYLLNHLLNLEKEPVDFDDVAYWETYIQSVS